MHEFSGGQLSKVVAIVTCVMNHGTKDGWISLEKWLSMNLVVVSYLKW